MNKVVLASGNKGKLAEIQAILTPFGIDVISQTQAGFCGDIEESGSTFAENASIKAHAVYKATHLPVIADDSGLMVDALDGAPGVYSHRFAGEGASDNDRIRKLLGMLENVPREKRGAKFVCVICYLEEDGTEHFFTGQCPGEIDFAMHGENGFGYDPIFRALGEDKTMAGLSATQKNKISHRARALEELQAYLEKEEGLGDADE